MLAIIANTVEIKLLRSMAQEDIVDVLAKLCFSEVDGAVWMKPTTNHSGSHITKINSILYYIARRKSELVHVAQAWPPSSIYLHMIVAHF